MWHILARLCRLYTSVYDIYVSISLSLPKGIGVSPIGAKYFMRDDEASVCDDHMR